jgi:ADP-ribose pyrophosphatase YjhB (NUDIX family)
MKYQQKVNDIQAGIMRRLITQNSLRFSEINTDNLPSDQFSYHLRQLIKYGLVQKSDDQRYSLSVLGRSRSLLLDAHSNKFIEQGFVASRIIMTRQTSKDKEYLTQIRTRVPYKDYLGETGGKVLFGEDVAEASKRNMLVETGLTCDMEVKGLVHFKDQYQGRIVQDKYFFVVLATNPKGSFKPEGPTGKNQWMTMEEIKAYPQVYQGVLEMFEMAEGKPFGFLEQTHVTTEY